MYIIGYILIGILYGVLIYFNQAKAAKLMLKQEIVEALTYKRIIATVIVKGLLWPVCICLEIGVLILGVVLSIVFKFVK